MILHWAQGTQTGRSRINNGLLKKSAFSVSLCGCVSLRNHAIFEPQKDLVGGEVSVRGVEVARQLDCFTGGQHGHNLQPERGSLLNMRPANLACEPRNLVMSFRTYRLLMRAVEPVSAAHSRLAPLDSIVAHHFDDS